MKPALLTKLWNNITHIDRETLERHFLDLAGQYTALEAGVQCLLEAIILLDSRGRVVFVNASARNMFGIPDRTQKKWTVHNLFEDQELKKLISSTFETGQSFSHRVVKILFPRPRMLHVAMIRMGGEASPGYIIRALDVTDIYLAEQDQLKRERLASVLTLAQGIAHEIGNPLNSINIQLKLLQKEAEALPANKKEKITNVLGILLSETNRMDRCIRQFLSVTRRPQLRFRKVKINSLLRDAYRFLQEEMAGARVRTMLELAPELPDLLGDADQLYRAFINIMKNAIEAMPDGGTLTIRSRKKDGLMVVEFQDTGMGIPKHQQAHIFDLYHTTKAEGSGIGLSIVQQVVDEHGGRVELHSRPGHGATFSVILPIRHYRYELPDRSRGGTHES